MPSTPGVLNYPSSLDDAISLISVTNNAQTTLNGSITNGALTTLAVASTVGFPTSGTLYVGPPGPGAEVMSYTGISGNTFTGIVRAQDGTAPQSQANNAAVTGFVVALHHTTHNLALIALQTKLGITPGGNQNVAATGTYLRGSGAGQTSWAGLSAADINASMLSASLRVGSLGVGIADIANAQQSIGGIVPLVGGFSSNGLYMAPQLTPATATNAVGIDLEPTIDMTGPFAVNPSAYGIYLAAYTKVGALVPPVVTGLRVEKQTIGAVNHDATFGGTAAAPNLIIDDGKLTLNGLTTVTPVGGAYLTVSAAGLVGTNVPAGGGGSTLPPFIVFFNNRIGAGVPYEQTYITGGTITTATGCRAIARTGATGQSDFTIWRSTGGTAAPTNLGTIRFAAGGGGGRQLGTFIWTGSPATITIANNDTFIVTAPAASDGSLADVSITMVVA